ncbi:MAG: heavy metal translocating P-type ATPase [Bacteroides sp.]|nr:heavy metal translocating P-type ATPase [Bacteroides sp.]MBP6066724.1 heavy metal translocating P-type ATPase [Bacteroides sp.]MBP6935440.1 heavy metal translocating P-type ATPase [Bacteroides sp.]MBP8622102.1 heavy metal translocating P-type ATPase [Bacteroides sp.]MBP9506713.1 heavy metal translocating P-type ATPase [Bacteroides sp.]
MGCNCSHRHEDNRLKTGWVHYRTYLPALISFMMIVTGALFNHFGLFQTNGVALLWYAIAYVLVGFPVLKEAVQSLLQLDFFNEFTLMSIATIGAFSIGEYPEGVAVMLFYYIGELFQARAVGKAKRNIRDLLDVRPETATVWHNGLFEKRHPQQVKVGEVVEVKVGERIPLDGQLLNEQAFFNTAALTGESVPRTIRQGEEVLAGMIATDRVVRIQVDKPYDQSALARILTMVEEAAERKAPAELFMRKFARIYTPIVTGLAVLIVLLPFLWSLLTPGFTFVWDDWFYRSLVFLVISCPCALVVSIPLGYFGGIGAASRAGILFKGSNYLDAITQVNTVVFDKTGTLTQGIFEVQHLESLNPDGEWELLQLIASAEQQSNHPIAQAIARYGKTRGVPLLQVTDTIEIAGHGLRVLMEGREILVGNSLLLARQGIPFPEQLSEVSETIVVCAVDGSYAGYLSLSDSPKADAAQAIRDLQALNITNIQILSGDKQAIVSTLASELGVKQAYGDLLPEGKVNHIEKLKEDPNNRIAFVGDGINDAPVLALSHIGIAMGGLGSDAAIETADVVLQTDHPSRMATAIRIGLATRKIVWQNIGLAFGVKLIVLLLGAGGLATLWEAVFADVGVALLAILNAIRIQHKKF